MREVLCWWIRKKTLDLRIAAVTLHIRGILFCVKIVDDLIEFVESTFESWDKMVVAALSILTVFVVAAQYAKREEAQYPMAFVAGIVCFCVLNFAQDIWKMWRRRND